MGRWTLAELCLLYIIGLSHIILAVMTGFGSHDFLLFGFEPGSEVAPPPQAGYDWIDKEIKYAEKPNLVDPNEPYLNLPEKFLVGTWVCWVIYVYIKHFS